MVCSVSISPPLAEALYRLNCPVQCTGQFLASSECLLTLFSPADFEQSNTREHNPAESKRQQMPFQVRKENLKRPFILKQ